tara:strand:+ start:15 stop:263 length:249 start_codon:yes stop_codon:yes gene_type:complete
MSQDILNFIKKSLKNKKINNENLKKNYFQEGLMDSFQLMVLISNLEKHYNIKFTNNEFENNKFFTILGISNIVSKKIKSKKK